MRCDNEKENKSFAEEIKSPAYLKYPINERFKTIPPIRIGQVACVR